mgnify:CR=1 FL=1
MAKVELIMPKMGESVAEATVIQWLKNVGESIELDESVIEIATDKVDSEIPSTVKGILLEQRFQKDDVVKVGEVVAIIETDGDSEVTNIEKDESAEELEESTEELEESIEELEESIESIKSDINIPSSIQNKKFYSPLVKNIAQKEGINQQELSQINGTGKDKRVTKNDILNYIKSKVQTSTKKENNSNIFSEISSVKDSSKTIQKFDSSDTEIIEMSRMRKLIAEHMVMSKSTSPHVTSFNEVDMSNIVNWRNKIKDKFSTRENQKITYTPIIIEAIVKAIIDLPMINISVEKNNIIKHKKINIGMATALPSGNLIVPVIKNSSEKNLLGLTKSVNDLSFRARNGKLVPDDTNGGTFTFTNVGTFGSVMGTPIINQPQVAILAAGVIQKKPSVVETEYGDAIVVRHKMFLSLSYDHRVVDGALGGSFLKRIAHYLESFDVNREI